MFTPASHQPLNTSREEFRTSAPAMAVQSCVKMACRKKMHGQIWAPQAGGPAGTDNVAAKPAPEKAQDLHIGLYRALEISNFLPTLRSSNNTLTPCTYFHC